MAIVDNTVYTAENEMVGEFWQKALLGRKYLILFLQLCQA